MCLSCVCVCTNACKHALACSHTHRRTHPLPSSTRTRAHRHTHTLTHSLSHFLTTNIYDKYLFFLTVYALCVIISTSLWCTPNVTTSPHYCSHGLLVKDRAATKAANCMPWTDAVWRSLTTDSYALEWHSLTGGRTQEHRHTHACTHTKHECIHYNILPGTLAMSSASRSSTNLRRATHRSSSSA